MCPCAHLNYLISCNIYVQFLIILYGFMCVFCFFHLCPLVLSSVAASNRLLDILINLFLSFLTEECFLPKLLFSIFFFFQLIFNSECQQILKPDKQRTGSIIHLSSGEAAEVDSCPAVSDNVVSATQCDSLVGLNAPEFKNVKKKKKKKTKKCHKCYYYNKL